MNVEHFVLNLEHCTCLTKRKYYIFMRKVFFNNKIYLNILKWSLASKNFYKKYNGAFKFNLNI